MFGRLTEEHGRAGRVPADGLAHVSAPRVVTRAYYEWDGAEYVLIEEDSIPYDGEWALCKESSAEKARRQQMEQQQFQANQNYYNIDLPAQRKLAQDTLDLQKSQYADYKQMMQDALNKQYAWLDPIAKQMMPYLTGEKGGFTPEEETQLNAQMMDDLSSGYGDASSAVRQALASRGGFGGDQPVGGDTVRGLAELETGMANNVAAGRRDTRLQSIRQLLANKFNAANVLMGGASQFGGDVGVASGGRQGAAAGVAASGNLIPGAPQQIASQYYPKPQGFWGSLGKTLLGQGTSMALTAGMGGFGNMFSNLSSSWFKPKPSPYGMVGMSG